MLQMNMFLFTLVGATNVKQSTCKSTPDSYMDDISE